MRVFASSQVVIEDEMKRWGVRSSEASVSRSWLLQNRGNVEYGFPIFDLLAKTRLENKGSFPPNGASSSCLANLYEYEQVVDFKSDVSRDYIWLEGWFSVVVVARRKKFKIVDNPFLRESIECLNGVFQMSKLI
jgi:hypothetical protein